MATSSEWRYVPIVLKPLAIAAARCRYKDDSGWQEGYCKINEDNTRIDVLVEHTFVVRVPWLEIFVPRREEEVPAPKRAA